MLLIKSALLKEIDKAAILPNDLGQTLKRGVIFSVSVSSTNENVTSMLEPGAATPQERFHVLKEIQPDGFRRDTRVRRVTASWAELALHQK